MVIHQNLFGILCFNIKSKQWLIKGSSHQLANYFLILFQVTTISDHFPIEVTLRSRASLPQVMTLMSLLLSISVVTQSFVSL